MKTAKIVPPRSLLLLTEAVDIGCALLRAEFGTWSMIS